MKLASYQQDALARLNEAFIKAWSSGKKQCPVVLKSPTGSGKTVMLANFVQGLNKQPNWDEDKAFVWITFSEDLALQSRDKFEIYFGTSQENRLLTVDDVSQGTFSKNDILFLNWQKLVSKSAENRKLRRPEDPLRRKEQGGYFEDFIDSASSTGRNIILIIDEAHQNVTPDLAQEIIDYISPRVVIHVTATPKPEIVAKAADAGTYVNVDRGSVVAEGLIKEKIVIQTAEDLKDYQGQDFDHTLLDLGLKKRDELALAYKKLGKKINPLLLIQLPNDDSSLVSLGEKTKEQVVTEYLLSKGIDEARIGRWFDSHARPAFIENNDDEHDVLIFKLAAGTGWDCPRAQVLVMFRNIKVEQRYIQTVGRILRMPDPMDPTAYKDSPELRAGYLYTNYDRKDIADNWLDGTNDPALVVNVNRRITDGGVELQSDFLSRADYGDLSSSFMFQTSFITSMDKHFGLENVALIQDRLDKLQELGLDLKPSVTSRIVVDAQFQDFDHLNLDFHVLGKEVNVEMSANDIEKTFNLLCWNALKEQTEDAAKISNIARSWSPLKSALRVWLKGALGLDAITNYKVAISDFAKGPKSLILPGITQALKDYRPILDSLVAGRQAQERTASRYTFTIAESYSYPADFELKQYKHCALDALAIPKGQWPGRENELDFADYLDASEPQIDWWFKQGIGRDYFGIQYTNKNTGKVAVFYPDWIVKLKSGKFLVIDTKMGRTAEDAAERSEALVKHLAQVGTQFVGGIAIKANGIWYLNSSEAYAFNEANLGADWKPLEEILKS
jgi:type III restriction enzyme